MKFLALFLNEIKESVFVVLILWIALIPLGWLILQENYYYFEGTQWGTSDMMDEASIDISSDSLFEDTGMLLLFISVSLGVSFAIQHFCIPSYRKVWGFIIHRSVTKKTIIFMKLISAAFLLFLSIGGVWGTLFIIGSNPARYLMPPNLLIFIHGLFLISVGYVAYLCVGLSGISNAKWYETRSVWLLVGLLLIIIFSMRMTLMWGILFLIFFIFVLACELISVFCSRDF